MSASPVSGEEQVRRVLQDLAIAAERGDPNGVSCAEMARCVGVSRQHMQRVLSAEYPSVNLRFGQAERLPPRAQRAVFEVMKGWVQAGVPVRAPESRARRIGVLKGRLDGEIDAAMADGEIDADEARRLRLLYADIGAEAQAGGRDLERHLGVACEGSPR